MLWLPEKSFFHSAYKIKRHLSGCLFILADRLGAKTPLALLIRRAIRTYGCLIRSPPFQKGKLLHLFWGFDWVRIGGARISIIITSFL